MFYRDCLQYLHEWRMRTNRKPLILRGARQVGKTTVVNAFAQEFERYIYLNLETEDIRLFNPELDIERTIQSIAYTKHSTIDANTLLFIDEIQNSPIAIQYLRFFFEKHPEVCVIAAGSLLESYAGRNFSFPVGRVEYYAMRPCTFYEFLSAIGEEEDKQTILAQKGSFIHERLMRFFQQYTMMGGMPEAVKVFAETRDLRANEPVYQTLLTSYQDDVEKYAQNKTQIAVIRYILQYGWAQAGEIITYERFAGSNYKSREISEAFLTLQKSMLLETVFPSTSVTLPLMPAMTRHPKLLWLDTGLVNFQAGLRDELFLAHDIQDVYRGRIAEHIVGQELITLNSRVDAKRAFWQKNEKSEAEVDYLYLFESAIIPLEVKSGVNARLKSLQQFMALAQHNVAVRVWSKPFEVCDVENPVNGKVYRLLNIPFYMVGMLDKILKQYI